MTVQKETAIEVLKHIETYVHKQLKDIPTWNDVEDDIKNARIDELQCLDTFIQYKLALQTDSVDDHYNAMFGDAPERRIFYISLENNEVEIEQFKKRLSELIDAKIIE